MGENLQPPSLDPGQIRPRNVVDDAERPEVMPLGRGQHRAGVEADLGPARDQGIVPEPRIQAGVGHHHHPVRSQLHRVGAEGLIARRFEGVQAEGRLEPLPAGVDQRHQRDGRVEEVGAEGGEPIELLGRRDVQHPVVAKRAKSRDLFFLDGGSVFHPGQMLPTASTNS